MQILIYWGWWFRMFCIMEKDRGTTAKYCLAAAGCTLAALLVIFGVNGILPGGDRTFLYGDAFVQYVPIIKLFLRHLFGGESLLYSFEAGMGMPTIALYAYYCLSPFNLLFLLVQDPDAACFIVFAAKLMSASAAMAFLLHRNRDVSLKTAAVLSNAYVLCGFVMTFSFGLIFFDMMIIMPILLWALIRFVKTGKWIALCIIYFLSFVIHFYSAYMLGVFSFVLYLCYGVAEYGKDMKRWGSSILKYCLSVFLAVLLSAPVLLPAAMELFGHLGTDSTVLESLSLGIPEFITAFYPGASVSASAYNTVPMLYFGLLPLVFYIVFFADKEKEMKEKIIAAVPAVFLLICCFWKSAYIFMHAFDAPDGYCFRFSWLFGFWIIYVAAEEAERIAESRRAAVISLVLLLLYIAVTAIRTASAEGAPAISDALMGAAFLLAYAGILWLRNKERDLLIVLGLVFLAETVCNGIITQSAYTGDKSRDGGYYAIWREQAGIAMQYMAEEEQKDGSEFYRVYYGNPPFGNVSMLYGFRGLGWFLSIENENVRALLDTLGYATSSRTVQDYGSTALTRMLFSQKYSINGGSFYDEHPESMTVEKNERTLPPAYLVPAQITDLELVKKDPFSAQEQLAEALTGEGYDIWNVGEEPYTAEPEQMSLIPYEEGVYLQREAEGVLGSTVLSFGADVEDQVYVYVSRDEYSADDPDSPLIFSDEDMGGLINRPRLFMPRIFPASKKEDGGWQCFLYMTGWGYELVDYSKLFYASLNDSELDRLYEDLSDGGIELSAASEAQWHGRVAVKDDRAVLLTTIPYDEGWEIYADGEKLKSLSLLEGAFLGAELPKGSHELNIVFKNKWILPGLMCGAAGIIMLSVFYLAERRKREKI